ncbi:hypothetical protein T05_15749 [Trichinella murrelli]|uniref:Uncharacterized protein n=1 Tax=Trichinella murrelli TaxID=144512 RepID=A0A0V0T7H2_9BILA|nr:hypothetical protein T05_15749 [Trichinella murrelli]
MNDQHRHRDLPDIPPMPHLVVSEGFLFFVQIILTLEILYYASDLQEETFNQEAENPSISSLYIPCKMPILTE